MEVLEQYTKRAEILFPTLTHDIDFPENATTLEKCILLLRSHMCSYKSIQNQLGAIPKQLIRDTLKKYDASLIDLDTNNHKIPDAYHKLCMGDWNWEEFKKNK